MKFLFTADWHLRPDRPRCRIDDDWFLTQKKQIKFVNKVSIKYNVPVIICGDIFHRSQVPDIYKNLFLKTFKKPPMIIAGQHDEPYHSFSNIESSSFGVLIASGGAIYPGSIGQFEHYGENISGDNKDIVFLHKLIFEDKNSMPPNSKAYTAEDILNLYPNAKWIFSGDNHHGFHYQKNGRHVVMAGCLNRQASNFKNYLPSIWLIDIDNSLVEKIFIPDDPNLLIDDYIKDQKEKNERIGSFVETIKNMNFTGLNYLDNIDTALRENELEEDVLKIINELIEEANGGTKKF